jgi:hypothetical protein
MIELGAPIQWEDVANITQQATQEQAMRKKREELEASLRKEQEQNTKDAKQNELKQGCIHNLITQFIYGSSDNKRDKLEASLRREQERKTNDSKVKEIKKVLELGGIHKTMSDSEYLSIITCGNKRARVLDFIGPVRELQSEYLNCSSYYYNQETDTIFEIENIKEELRIVNGEVERTLRVLNKL